MNQSMGLIADWGWEKKKEICLLACVCVLFLCPLAYLHPASKTKRLRDILFRLQPDRPRVFYIDGPIDRGSDRRRGR